MDRKRKTRRRLNAVDGENQRALHRESYQRNHASRRKAAKAYETENRERLAKYQRERWAANREENHHKRAEYRKKNVELIRVYNQRSHERNREKHNAQMREWYAKNREKCNATSRAWYEKAKTCPEMLARVRENLKQNAKRHFFATRAAHIRCRSRSASASLSAVSGFDLWCLWKRQRGRCALTGESLDRAAHVDHIVSRACGGSSDITNLRFLSARANLIKRAYTDAELLEFCAAVIATIGGSHP